VQKFLPDILYVDDDELLRRTFKRTLQKQYGIITAESAAEAKKILASQAHEIGVIVSDQRMKREDGISLLEYCRELYPDIVRVMATGYRLVDTAINAVNRGQVARWIMKPWDNAELSSYMAQCISLHLRQIELTELLNRQKESIFSEWQDQRVRDLVMLMSSHTSPTRFEAAEDLTEQLRSFAEKTSPKVIGHIDSMSNSINAINMVEAMTAHARDAEYFQDSDPISCDRINANCAGNIKPAEIPKSLNTRLYDYILERSKSILSGKICCSVESDAKNGLMISYRLNTTPQRFLGQWLNDPETNAGNGLLIGEIAALSLVCKNAGIAMHLTSGNFGSLVGIEFMVWSSDDYIRNSTGQGLAWVQAVLGKE